MTRERDLEDDSADDFRVGDLPIEADEDGIEIEEDDDVDCPSCGEPLDLTSGECLNPDCDA